MRKIIFIRILNFWAVLLCLLVSFVNQSNGEEIMFSSKKAEKELLKAVKDAGHRLEWRTLAGGIIMNFPEGKVIREIKSEWGIASSLSPDATQIAFFQPRSSSAIEAIVESRDLMLEDINDGTQQSLGLIARRGGFLAWSPDGKKLAFFAEEATTDPQVKWPERPFLFGEPGPPTKLFIFSIADKTLETFDLPGSGGPIANDQIWSPAGDEILYTVLHSRKPPLDVEIRILSLVTKATRSLARGENPAWSLIHNKIIFRSEDKNYYMINPDGSEKTLLLKPNPKELYDLNSSILWSPDGRWLLVPRGSYWDTTDIFIMDVETKIMVKIESQTQPRSSWKGKK